MYDTIRFRGKMKMNDKIKNQDRRLLSSARSTIGGSGYLLPNRRVNKTEWAGVGLTPRITGFRSFLSLKKELNGFNTEQCSSGNFQGDRYDDGTTTIGCFKEIEKAKAKKTAKSRRETRTVFSQNDIAKVQKIGVNVGSGSLNHSLFYKRIK